MHRIAPRTVVILAAATLSAGLLTAQTARAESADNAAPQTGSLTDDLDTRLKMDAAASGHIPASARPVSTDILRHPLKEKVRRLLQRALEAMNAGNHQAAIGELKEALHKYPGSALYVQSFLGVEYVKTQQFENAVRSFEQAASLLPHDAMTHYNFGLSLACTGDYTRAEEETRRALELDPNIVDAQTLMAVLEQRKAPID